jgi:hypothetical protein
MPRRSTRQATHRLSPPRTSAVHPLPPLTQVGCRGHIAGLRLDHVSAVSEANGTTVPVSLDRRSKLSIQPSEGSRFVRGGRYGISIDFAFGSC